MSELSSRAAALHGPDHNCAQAVLLCFCEKYGLDPATADALACGLGGGARCGELCGALSGAILVVGLKTGAAGREPCATEVRRLTDAFRAKAGAVRCHELLGSLAAPATPEQQAARKTRCGGFIRLAVETLEEMGY